MAILIRRTASCGRLVQVFSELVSVPTTKKEPAKVTNMVGTFLTTTSDGFQVPATQAASEKVANMVATFLPDDMDRMRIIRVTTKADS